MSSSAHLGHSSRPSRRAGVAQASDGSGRGDPSSDPALDHPAGCPASAPCTTCDAPTRRASAPCAWARTAEADISRPPQRRGPRAGHGCGGLPDVVPLANPPEEARLRPVPLMDAADVRDVLTGHVAYSSVDSFAMESGGTTADLPAVMISTSAPPDHTALRSSQALVRSRRAPRAGSTRPRHRDRRPRRTGHCHGLHTCLPLRTTGPVGVPRRPGTVAGALPRTAACSRLSP